MASSSSSAPLSPSSSSWLNECADDLMRVVAAYRESPRADMDQTSLYFQAIAVLPADRRSEQHANMLIQMYNDRLRAAADIPALPPQYRRGDLAAAASDTAAHEYNKLRPSMQRNKFPLASLSRAYSLSQFGVVSDYALQQLVPNFNRDAYGSIAWQNEVSGDGDTMMALLPEEDWFPSRMVKRSLDVNNGGDIIKNQYVRYCREVAIGVVVEFQQSTLSGERQELQFHCRLWDRLLNALLRPLTKPLLTSVLELSMAGVIEGYSPQFADYACMLAPDNNDEDRVARARQLPLLLVEVSSHAVGNEEDHKDFRKLLVMMAVTLLARIGSVRRRPVGERSSLRQFGLLVGAFQFQPVVMIPIFDNDHDAGRVSFVARCDPTWRSFVRTPSHEAVQLQGVYSDIEAPQSLDRDNEAFLTELAHRVASAAAAVARTRPPPDPAPQQADVLNRLRSLSSFCDAVRRQASVFHAMLSHGDVEDVFPYPTSFGPPPSSRPSTAKRPHSQRTPSKQSWSPRTSSSGRPPRKRGRSDGPSRTRQAASVALVDDLAVKHKMGSAAEEPALMRDSQGDGVARLFGSIVLPRSNGGGVVLVEERLDDVDFGQLSVNDIGLVLVRFFIDGLAALGTLSRAGIVHRDINPNNIMYSVAVQGWRVTDFDLACRVDDPQTGVELRPGAGTQGYIAPEALDAGVYSAASDMWSLGRTAAYFLSCAQDEVWRRPDAPHKFDDVLCHLEMIAHNMSAPEPAQRVVSPSVHEFLVDFHNEFQQNSADNGFIARR
ncbi:Protein kinase domain-containing protein [Plasmodiophora brassicae]